MPTKEQILELLELELSGPSCLRDPHWVQCHTQRVTRDSNPDGGFAERAQEPGCWVTRARGDSESEHRMGDKLLSLGKSRWGDTLSICYTPASSSTRDPVSKASKSPHH